MLSTVFGLNHFLIVVYDNMQVKLNSPVLSDFETPFELTRWREMSTAHEIIQSEVRNGNSALKVTFAPGKHPHAVLREMIHDWSNYGNLNFSIYNPANKNNSMLILIHDHDSWRNSDDYKMRFDKKLSLKPGWNDISISTEEIKNAPRNRQLELHRIYSVSFILQQPKISSDYYLDHIYLSN